jgi:hypothetical protein
MRSSSSRAPTRGDRSPRRSSNPPKGLFAAAKRLGVDRPERFRDAKGKLLALLFETVAEQQLVNPTFLHEVSDRDLAALAEERRRSGVGGPVRALRRRHGDRQRILGAERSGRPGGALRKQAEERTKGDLEAAEYDAAYVEALEYGLPPHGGGGNRHRPLDDALTDRHSIRDVILFPLLSAPMSFETSVAMRYLAASRRRAHVALISTISMLGLAVGVAALVISLSLLSGFQDRIRAQMAERTPHLRVSPARGSVLPEPDRVRQALASLRRRGHRGARNRGAGLGFRFGCRVDPSGPIPKCAGERAPGLSRRSAAPRRVSAAVSTGPEPLRGISSG